jgi:hypothetical protein
MPPPIIEGSKMKPLTSQQARDISLIDKQRTNQACIDRQVVRIESARLELLASLTANDANQYDLAKSMINEVDMLVLIVERQVLAATNN